MIDPTKRAYSKQAKVAYSDFAHYIDLRIAWRAGVSEADAHIVGWAAGHERLRATRQSIDLFYQFNEHSWLPQSQAYELVEL